MCLTTRAWLAHWLYAVLLIRATRAWSGCHQLNRRSSMTTCHSPGWYCHNWCSCTEAHQTWTWWWWWWYPISQHPNDKVSEEQSLRLSSGGCDWPHIETKHDNIRNDAGVLSYWAGALPWQPSVVESTPGSVPPACDPGTTIFGHSSHWSSKWAYIFICWAHRHQAAGRPRSQQCR